MKQSEHFLGGEADKWDARNYDKIHRTKLWDEATKNVPFAKNTDVLEIGCGRGQRLQDLASKFDCNCYGVEPSSMAVHKSPPWVNVKQGTADNIPFEDGMADIVILGFCLYLVDKEDLFKVAYEADRVLKDGGHLIIEDFWTETPHSKTYHHNTELRSYKTDRSKMFIWHPAYTVTNELGYVADPPGTKPKEHFDYADIISIFVLRKNMADAFPLRETA